MSTMKWYLATQVKLITHPASKSVSAESANGETLHYTDRVLADLSLADSLQKLSTFLLVPDRAHTKSVPILIATNNLDQLLPQQQQEAHSNLHSVMQCLLVKRKTLSKKKNGESLTFLYPRANPPLYIPPRSDMTLDLGVRSLCHHPSPLHTLWSRKHLMALHVRAYYQRCCLTTIRRRCRPLSATIEIRPLEFPPGQRSLS